MYCRYCNAELMAGAVFCAQCGKPVAAGTAEVSSDEDNSNDQPAPFTLAAPANGPSVTPSDLQQPTTYPSEQFGSSPQMPVYPGQQPGPNAQPYPPQFGYGSPSYYQGTIPGSQFNFQPPFAEAPQPPTLPTPPKRRRLSPVLVSLLIVLVLLVGGGGVFAYFVITRGPSLQSTITTNDPQQLYMQATRGAPTLTDPLNDSNPNHWQPSNSNSNSTCTFSESALHAGATAAGSGQTTDAVCVAPATHFNDFAYQVDMTNSQGNITGLAFRIDASVRVVYLFGISSAGAYYLAGASVDSSGNPTYKVLAQGRSQAIQTTPDTTNLLTVIARGGTIDLYVNQRYLAQATDNTASGGEIGVFGEDTQGGVVDAVFTSIQVWQL